MSNLIEQIRKARTDYMTNEYDGHGDVCGYLYFSHEDWSTFRSEVEPYMMRFDTTTNQPVEFEGINLMGDRVDKSFVEFMYYHNTSPYRYSLATAKHYYLSSGEDDERS